ncbi:hypothetical protein BDF14DRAFT_1804106 [Spinellus fusiger]|nr:hypothetical protein BDF14DRAFT_1804106 [Spinellus fusiger]
MYPLELHLPGLHSPGLHSLVIASETFVILFGPIKKYTEKGCYFWAIVATGLHVCSFFSFLFFLF